MLQQAYETSRSCNHAVSIIQKNRTSSDGFAEMTVEVKVHRNDTSFVEELEKVKNVNSVVLVEYTGDYAV